MPSKAHLFDAKNDLDRSTVLCLACSSSLPPIKHSSGPSSSISKTDPNAIFTTNCCQRPICPACIKANPRLARYDPCLACLGGVSVVGSRSASGGLLSPKAMKSPTGVPDTNYNLDGAVRDEDTFVLGDDEDVDDADLRHEYISGAGGMIFENVHHDSAPPPPYEAQAGDSLAFTQTDEKSADAFPEDNPVKPVSLLRNKSSGSDLIVSAPPPASAADEELASSSSAPYKYYVSRGDTMQGISLRFGVDSQEICKLNKLPTSVMRTMPQLLHTRAFLLLPATASAKATTSTDTGTKSALKTTPVTDDKVRQREARLVRERAGKKLQTLTKEVDYHVAKAYVALADDLEEQEMSTVKRKEMMGSGSSKSGMAGASGTPSGSRGPQGALEALAIQQYLEDNEWEEEERRAGRGPRTHPLPSPGPFSFSAIASKVGL
ncbi:hypothetical protein D9619_004189 [Psilocybe cf. subviscida]|uniref:LysM domain-containing protein n=1 Tax=Psilocybe cf. subviscida TaxID=2480587 RepID=A0A8H5F7X3_9AGAR|nr:hypothetical protein D9619_004189 [Psilocybe cf. subviscida]